MAKGGKFAVIIAAYNPFLLRRRLRRDARCRGGFYFSPGALPQSLEHEMARAGLRPIDLPEFSPDEREQALREYIDLVDRLGRNNARHDLWWTTELAAKNRFTSPLTGLLTDFARCQQAVGIASQNGRPLVIWRPPWPWLVTQQVVEMPTRNAILTLAWPGSRWLARLCGRIAAWSDLLRGVIGALAAILMTRRLGAQRLIPDTGNRAVFLIRSFIYPGSVSAEAFHDPFFGRLRDIVSATLGDEVVPLTIVQGTAMRTQAYQSLFHLPAGDVVPLEAYLDIGDVLAEFGRAIRALIFTRFSVPGNLRFQGADTSPACRELLASGGWRLQFFQLLHRRAATNITRRHRLAACALTFEGNAWERMFASGLRGGAGKPSLLGFQHSVVPLSAAGVFAGPDEISALQPPDRVLSTGRIPATLLQRYSALPASRFCTSGALRYEHLHQLPLAPRRRDDTRRILVALEGVGPVLSMLEYALEQAELNPQLVFRVRSHPVLPLETLLRRLDRVISRLPANVEIADGQAVHDDVQAADAVLYWGSTLAIEALFMGRPAIHYSAGELLSYDPLFELNDFKWTVHRGAGLDDVLSGIEALDDHEYAKRQVKARAYVSAYFEPVNDRQLGAVLRQALSERDRHDGD